MEGTLFSVLMLALILGIKHAIEPDHVIAGQLQVKVKSYGKLL